MSKTKNVPKHCALAHLVNAHGASLLYNVSVKCKLNSHCTSTFWWKKGKLLDLINKIENIGKKI